MLGRGRDSVSSTSIPILNLLYIIFRSEIKCIRTEKYRNMPAEAFIVLQTPCSGPQDLLRIKPEL